MQIIKFPRLEICLLILIAVFAGFLYLYKLNTSPPGVYLDEAGTGYNIFSILKTGKDEYGMAFPIAFRLFGSYTPPLYIYLSVPLMKIFGLSAFSTRLLSAISGTLAILVVFLLIKQLKITNSKITPLVSILFFAITPWLIFFSRIGYEQNLAFLFFCVSALLIAKSLKNPRLLLLTIPFISLATYTDYPQRLTAPLLFIGTAILFWKKFDLLKNKKSIFIGILVAAIIQIPNLFLIQTPAFYTKSNHFYSDVIADQAVKIEHYLPPVVSRPLSFTREFSSQYFTYLSPRSLFFLPDEDPQRSTPALSVFYPWMIIPYVCGIYFLWKKRKGDSAKLILLLLLIAPIPGAIAKQPFHDQRTLALLLPISLILTLSYDKFISVLPKKALLLIPFLVLVSLLMFWRSYFILLPQERSLVWGFEWKPLAQFIATHPDKKFVVDQSDRIKPQDMAYPQLAFYLQIDPSLIQADQKPNFINNYYTDVEFSFIHKFSNIETRPIDWGETDYKDEIIVGDELSISDDQAKLHNLTKVFEVRGPNNELALRAFQTNPKK